MQMNGDGKHTFATETQEQLIAKQNCLKKPQTIFLLTLYDNNTSSFCFQGSESTV